MASSRTRVRIRADDLIQHIHDVQHHRELVQLVYRSHERWPLSSKSQSSTLNTPERSSIRDLRISVLDSSFNPPTLAHLALARSTPTGSRSRSAGITDAEYDARLLLLSVRNADKAAPKPGEATFAQRLEMMMLLAQELEEAPSDSASSASGNVAVAIIDEPTFVQKSAVLRQFLQDLTTKLDEPDSEPDGYSNSYAREHTVAHDKQIKLTFIMGSDTLERFLAPRYYSNSLSGMHEALRKFFASPPEGDGSEVVCAWRGENKPENVRSREKTSQMKAPVSEMQETLSLARPFIASGSVSFTLLTDREMTLSSSEVRSRRSKGLLDWSAMVPAPVGDYIELAKLYVQD